jgi:hypothetical protein
MTVRTLAAVLAAALLAGCGGTGEEGVPPAPDAGPPVGAEPGPAGEMQTCANPTAGFTISYPGDWHTNAENGLPPCSVFDPDPIQLPEAGEVPPDLAVTIRRDDTAYEDMIAEDEFEDRTEEEGTIGGKRTLRVESTATGAGLLDAGTVSYRYYVDLDGQTLVAETNDVEAADFARNREVLDRMMETIQIQDFR